MHARFMGMTLQTVLQQHGITTIRDFAQRTGLSRQHAWNLWHAQVGLGTEMVKRLHTHLGIPFEALLQVDPVPARPRRPAAQTRPQPKGRPRTRRTQEDPGHA